jgi:hypothetical protein
MVIPSQLFSLTRMLVGNNQSVGWIEHNKLYLEHHVLEQKINSSQVDMNYTLFS